MFIPKVNFRTSNIDKIFPFIHEMLNMNESNWDWSNVFFKNYPKLKSKLSNENNIKKRKKIEYNFFKKYFEKNKEQFLMIQRKFQKNWNEINDDVMIALSDIIETSWSKEDKPIYAYISLSPICPRDIIKREFFVFYNINVKKMKSITIHELLHFIYFKKWLSIFPSTKIEHLDYPYLVWHLSEILTEVILNDQRIQNVFRYNFKTYDEYRKIKINNNNNKYLLDYFFEFYNKRDNFENFLKSSWSFIKKNQNLIINT